MAFTAGVKATSLLGGRGSWFIVLEGLFGDKEGVEHGDVGHVGVEGGDFSVADGQDGGEVQVEDFSVVLRGVVQRGGGAMPADEEVLEFEIHPVADNGLGALMDGVDSAGVAGDGAAAGEAPDGALRQDGLEEVFVGGAERGEELPGELCFFGVGIHGGVFRGVVYRTVHHVWLPGRCDKLFMNLTCDCGFFGGANSTPCMSQKR